MTRILVPVDGSPLARRAIETACEWWPDAELVLLHVIDPTEPGYSTATAVDVSREPLHGSPEWYERARELGGELLEAAAAEATEAGHVATTIQTTGRPDRCIVETAEREDAEHVVMGGHGRDGETRIALGSVAALVVERAPIPVTVVR